MTDRVRVGDTWKHRPSGIERKVYAIATYKERTGLEPTEFDARYGVTHIAVMTLNPDDRTDSSDMKLVDGRPFEVSSWVKVRGVERGQDVPRERPRGF